ncbi:LamG-like jellyroll fold domain-containing protein [Methylobacterium soli]|uniref:LamG domain-containing protein n=1 Tax=Methylobacterium soli TaxID=553447 RepID=A0A6L3SYX8_9HYPH|nr:LamG-like jellyroll fold domain-containing protein [Methylobacterium soli]KAB1079329.1 LamG domain-containing protein [Methylobacterium soli]GJE42969.1 hypothetical protein AEGHOMDF_2145 [Methylobacterium soli]
MVFNGIGTAVVPLTTQKPISSVCALNGRLYITMSAALTSTGMVVIEFAQDMIGRYTTSGRTARGNVASRNVTAADVVISTPGLVSIDVNHVHARVLPGAPLDAVGLAIPTVAVATAGGVSVIHPTGAVANITRATNGYERVMILADGRIIGSQGASNIIDIGPLPYAASATNTAWRTSNLFDGAAPSILPGTSNKVLAPGAIGKSAGLTFLAEDTGTPANGMVAYATKDYATGWQAGDIRLAALGEATTGNVVGATPLNLDGTSAAGWTLAGTNTIASVGGEIEVTYQDNASGALYTVTGLTAGQTYAFRGKYRKGTANGSARLRVRDGTTVLISADNATTTAVELAGQVTPTGTTLIVELLFTGTTPAAGQTIYADDLRLDVAVPDRSYKAKPLTVVGTLSRTAVATGADLTAVGGFSGTNYLEQPYSADLDFGTGDFMVAAWSKGLTTGNILWRQDPGGAGAQYGIDVGGSVARFVCGAATVSGVGIADGGWHLVVGTRRSGVAELWVDGVRVGIGADTTNLSQATAPLRLGVRPNGLAPASAGSQIALARVSAYASTPAQIAKMYRDEAPLFQDGAKCFLGGSSNAVADLDVDAATGILAVATGNGVSEFQGLRRVNYLSMANVAPLTNDAMKSVSVQGGRRLLIGGAQAVAHNDASDLMAMLNRYPPAPAPAAATAAEVRIGTDTTKPVTAAALTGSAAFQTLTDAATIAWPMDQGYNAKVTLGGARTLGVPTGMSAGIVYVLRAAQDATGSRTLAHASCFNFGAAGAPMLTGTASKEDVFSFLCVDATPGAPKFDFIGIGKGY